MLQTLADPSPTTETIRVIRHRNYRGRLLGMDALSVIAWASGALAAALYLGSGEIFQINSLGSAITAFGIAAGLIGTDLILIMLVLAARIPLLDRTFGHDHAIAVHRKLGKPALYLLLGHGVLLTIGYAITDKVDVIKETVALFGGIANVWLAYVGLGLLIAVVVSSLVAVRRKFPYEVWHGIHLLSYVAVGVALPHQLSAGAIIVEGSFAYYYWIALYVLSLGSILVWRFIIPLYYSFRHRLRVTDVEFIGDGVFSINLRGRDLDKLRVHGGQYAIWRFWTTQTWFHAHPISFSSVPTNDKARITVRVLGKGTERLAKLPRNTLVSIEGPYGIFTDRARTAPYLSIIAAGIGITPMRSLLEHTPLRPGEPTVLLRASSTADNYLWDEVEQLVRDNEGEMYVMAGPRPKGFSTWMSAESIQRRYKLQQYFPNLLDSDVYICGPQAWANLVEQDLHRVGVPKQQIHLERFES